MATLNQPATARMRCFCPMASPCVDREDPERSRLRVRERAALEELLGLVQRLQQTVTVGRDGLRHIVAGEWRALGGGARKERNHVLSFEAPVGRRDDRG